MALVDSPKEVIAMSLQNHPATTLSFRMATPHLQASHHEFVSAAEDGTPGGGGWLYGGNMTRMCSRLLLTHASI